MSSEKTKQEMRELIEAIDKWQEESGEKRSYVIALYDNEFRCSRSSEGGNRDDVKRIYSGLLNNSPVGIEASRERELWSRLRNNKE